LRLKGYGLGVSTQTLTLTHRHTSVLVGQPLRGSYRVSGLTGRESVHFAVHGPFTSAATRCTGTPRATARATVRGSGVRALPRWAPARTGYYAWQVVARGNSTTRPAKACGTAYLVQKNTDTHHSRAGGARTVRVGHAFGPDVIVAGFDRAEVHTVDTRVYGPFLHKDKATCTRHRLFRTLPTSIRGNKRWSETTVVNRDGNTGYYVFRSTLEAGTFMRSSQSRCGNTVHVTR
jgi:hypothetical protein